MWNHGWELEWFMGIIPCGIMGASSPLAFASWQRIMECLVWKGQGCLPLAQVAPSPVQPGFEHFQGWGSPSFSGFAPIDPMPLSLAGTSPHAPTSVHVVVAMTSANVSWEPGYDGGYEQTFSVWYGPL